MKVTVSFGETKIVVPCGDGDLLVRDLAEKALLRFKKSGHANKLFHVESLRIVSLSLACDNGILDWDDKVTDVLDDRELLIANYLLESATSPTASDVKHNGDLFLPTGQILNTHSGLDALNTEIIVPPLNLLEGTATTSTQTTIVRNRGLSPSTASLQIVSPASSTHSASTTSTTLQCPPDFTKRIDSEPLSLDEEDDNASCHTDASSLWPLPPPPIPPPLPPGDSGPRISLSEPPPVVPAACSESTSHNKQLLSLNQTLNQKLKPVKRMHLSRKHDTNLGSSDEDDEDDEEDEEYVYTSDDGTYDRRRNQMIAARNNLTNNEENASLIALSRSANSPVSVISTTTTTQKPVQSVQTVPPLSNQSQNTPLTTRTGQNRPLPCLPSYTSPSLPSAVSHLRGQSEERRWSTTATQQDSFSGGEEEDYPKLRADYFVRVGKARRTLIGTETSPGLLKWLDTQERSSQQAACNLFRSQPTSCSNTLERKTNRLSGGGKFCANSNQSSSLYQQCNGPIDSATLPSSILVRICGPPTSPLATYSPPNISIQVRPPGTNPRLYSNVGMAGDINRRESGLEVMSFSLNESLIKEGSLQADDRIVEINGHPLINVPFDRGHEMLLEALTCPEISLRILRCDLASPSATTDSNTFHHTNSKYILPPPPSIPPPPPPPLQSLPKSPFNEDPPAPPQRLTQPPALKPKPSNGKRSQIAPEAAGIDSTADSLLLNRRPPPPLPQRAPSTALSPKLAPHESVQTFNLDSTNAMLLPSSPVDIPSVSINVNEPGECEPPGKSPENVIPPMMFVSSGISQSEDDTIQSCSEENVETDDGIETMEESEFSGQFYKAPFMIQIDHELHAIMEDSAARLQRRKDTIDEIDYVVKPQTFLTPVPTSSTDSLQKAAQLPHHQATNVKKIGQKHVIELTKTTSGLGFSLTTRDNPVGGNNPVYVKKIIPAGSALQDGRLRVGDRILEIDCEDVTWRSQREIVSILREKDVGAIVEMIVSRQVEIVSPTISLCDGATLPRRQPSTAGEGSNQGDLHDAEMRQVIFQVDIQLLPIMANSHEPSTSKSSITPAPTTSSTNKKASTKESTPPRPTLGISVTGQGGPAYQEINGNSGGVYIKSLIENGAAQKDGRLKVGDQLLEINQESLCSLSSEEALSKLRKTIQKILASGESRVNLMVRRIPERTTSIATVNSAGSSGGHSVTISAEVHTQQQHHPSTSDNARHKDQTSSSHLQSHSHSTSSNHQPKYRQSVTSQAVASASNSHQTSKPSSSAMSDIVLDSSIASTSSSSNYFPQAVKSSESCSGDTTVQPSTTNAKSSNPQTDSHPNSAFKTKSFKNEQIISREEKSHIEPIYENLPPKLNSFPSNALQPIREISLTTISPDSVPQPIIDPGHDVIKAGVILDHAPIDEVAAHRLIQEMQQHERCQSPPVRRAVSYDDILSPEANERWCLPSEPADNTTTTTLKSSDAHKRRSVTIIAPNLADAASLSYQSQPDLLSASKKENPFARNTLARQTISAKRRRQGQLEDLTNKWQMKQKRLVTSGGASVSSTVVVGDLVREKEDHDTNIDLNHQSQPHRMRNIVPVTSVEPTTSEVRRRPSIYRCDSKGTISSSSADTVDYEETLPVSTVNKKSGSLPSLPTSPSISTFMDGREFVPLTAYSVQEKTPNTATDYSTNLSSSPYENIEQHKLKVAFSGHEKGEFGPTKSSRTGYNNTSFLRALQRSHSFNEEEVSDEDKTEETTLRATTTAATIVESDNETEDKKELHIEPVLSFKLAEMESCKTKSKSKIKKKVKVSLSKVDEADTGKKATPSTSKSKKESLQNALFRQKSDSAQKKPSVVVRTRTKEEAKLRAKSSGLAKLFRIKQGQTDSAGVPCTQSYYANIPSTAPSSRGVTCASMNPSLSYNTSISNQSDSATPSTVAKGHGCGGGSVTYESSSTSSMPLSTATCSAATAPAGYIAYDALSEVFSETPRSYMRKSRNVYEDAEFIYQNLSDIKRSAGLFLPPGHQQHQMHHFLSQNSSTSLPFPQHNIPARMSHSFNQHNIGTLFRHRQSQSVDETKSSLQPPPPLLIKSLPPSSHPPATKPHTHTSAFVELKSSHNLSRPPVVNPSPANVMPDIIEPYELQGEMVKKALIEDTTTTTTTCTEEKGGGAPPLDIKKPLLPSCATPDLMSFTTSSSGSPATVPHYQVGSDLYAQVNKPTVS